MMRDGAHLCEPGAAPRPSARGTTGALLKSALRMTGLGCWSWDLASGDLAFSVEAEKIFGELGPRPTFPRWFACVDEADANVLRAVEEQVRRGQRSFSFEYRFRRPDGRRRRLKSDGEVLTVDEHGAPLALAGTVLDLGDADAPVAAVSGWQDTLVHSAMAGDAWTWEQDESFRFTAVQSRQSTPVPEMDHALGMRRWELPNAVPLTGPGKATCGCSSRGGLSTVSSTASARSRTRPMRRLRASPSPAAAHPGRLPRHGRGPGERLAHRAAAWRARLGGRHAGRRRLLPFHFAERRMIMAGTSTAPEVQRSANRSRRHVVLADDHDLVRAGIVGLIELLPDVEVTAEASSGEELLSLLDHLMPDLVISDIHMPGIDGLEAVARIRQRHPALPVLVLSMHDTAEFVQRAVASGANGYLMKNAAPSELQHAVGTMLTLASYFNAHVARMLLERVESAHDQLTERQLGILSMIASGLSSKEIGYELGLSPKTVDVHRARIMERLQVRDVASLTRYAVRRGLIKA